MTNQLLTANGATPPPRNWLLAALPAAVLAALQPELQPVSLPLRRVLYEPGAPILAVYFPLTAIVSLLTLSADEQPVEVAIVGHDGIIGLPLFLGLAADHNQALVQVDGTALRVDAVAFRQLLTAQPALQSVLQRYTQLLLVHMSQSVACNRLHPMNERCARWLLETHDRVDGDRFPMTHEFLASMLGTRRASVTLAAGTLQHAGLVRYQRGQITVLDRTGLEAAACGCYQIIADATQQLVGLAPTRAH